MKRRIEELVEKYTSIQKNPYTPLTSRELESINVNFSKIEIKRYIMPLIIHIDRILKEDGDCRTLLVSIQLLNDVLGKIKRCQSSIYYNSAYDLLVRLKGLLSVEIFVDSTSEKTKILEACEKCFQPLFTNNTNINKSINEEIAFFEFLMNVMISTNDTEGIKAILARKPSSVNFKNKNGTSLFYKVIQKYISTKEEKYLRYAVIILENPTFEFDENEVRTILSSFDEKGEMPLNYGVLLKLINHYFVINSNGEIYLRNGYNAIKESADRGENRFGTLERIDMTSLRTVGFVRNSEKAKYGVDSIYTYSLDVTEDGFDIYYHFPDVDAILGVDSEEDVRARHLIESFHYNHRAIFLLNRTTLEKLRFQEGEKSASITFRLRIGPNDEVRELSVFPSVVSIDKIYTGKTISAASEKSKDIKAFNNIAEKFRKEDRSYSTMEGIIDPLSELVESCVYRIGEGSIPFVYRSILPEANQEKYLKRADTIRIIDKYWGGEKNRFYKKLVSRDRNDVVIYSTKLNNSLTVCKTAPIVNPQANYIALENQRLIKEFIKRNCGTRAVVYSVNLLKRSSKFVRSDQSEVQVMDDDSLSRINSNASWLRDMESWKQQLLLESIIASTVNREYYLKNSEVKRMLHNI